jgi:TRAP-type C4-dicarboxylate transport system permease small subunit
MSPGLPFDGGRMELLIRRTAISLLVIAGVVLAFMLIYTLTDVVMRALGRPIVGGFEIISFSGAVAIGFALPYTTLMKSHVLVDFALEKLSPTRRAGMEKMTRIVSILLFLWIGYNFFDYGLDLIRNKDVTPMFKMPFYPISFGLAFVCLIQSLVLVMQLFRIREGSR